LGTNAIPLSDGRCGPTNGPQCVDCHNGYFNRVNLTVRRGTTGLFYCGRVLRINAIPGSDG
jgi:hypothetical protein